MYALRILKSHGLSDEDLFAVFRAIVLSKLTYAIQAWWGFVGTSDRERLEAFLKRAKKAEFVNGNLPSLAELCDTADNKLFKTVVENSNHVLHPLLPPRVSRHMTLRKRRHDFVLPAKESKIMESNFLYRLLYKDAY